MPFFITGSTTIYTSGQLKKKDIKWKLKLKGEEEYLLIFSTEK